MPYIVDVEARKIKDLNNDYYEVKVTLESGVTKFASCVSSNVDKALEDINEYIAPNLIGLDSRNTKHIDNVLDKFKETHSELKLTPDETFTISIAILYTACLYENKEIYEVLGGLKANCLPNLIYYKEDGTAYECEEVNTLEEMVESFKTNKNLVKVNLDDYQILDPSDCTSVMNLVNAINSLNDNDNIMLLLTSDLLPQFTVGLNLCNMLITDEDQESLNELFRIKNELAM